MKGHCTEKRGREGEREREREREGERRGRERESVLCCKEGEENVESHHRRIR